MVFDGSRAMANCDAKLPEFFQKGKFKLKFQGGIKSFRLEPEQVTRDAERQETYGGLRQ